MGRSGRARTQSRPWRQAELTHIGLAEEAACPLTSAISSRETKQHTTVYEPLGNNIA
jgi:hypothetical protein